jgi:hypothetical protein
LNGRENSARGGVLDAMRPIVPQGLHDRLSAWVPQ